MKKVLFILSFFFFYFSVSFSQVAVTVANNDTIDIFEVDTCYVTGDTLYVKAGAEDDGDTYTWNTGDLTYVVCITREGMGFPPEGAVLYCLKAIWGTGEDLEAEVFIQFIDNIMVDVLQPKDVKVWWDGYQIQADDIKSYSVYDLMGRLVEPQNTGIYIVVGETEQGKKFSKKIFIP